MKYSLLTATAFASAVFALSGCTGPVIMGGDAAVIALTKPGSPPPANTKDQIGSHESWCYSTMGDPECYTQAQDVQPNRLINVDPQSRYPLDAQAYRQVIANEKIVAASASPTVLSPAPTVAVEQKDELGTANPPLQPDSNSISKLP